MSSQSDRIVDVADSLLGIEAELRRLGAWSAEAPPVEAFASTQPFCIDTLEFTEWLQFVFLAKMKVMVEQGGPFPAISGIAPMAEEYFRNRPESGQRLIRELAVVDRLLSSC